MDWRQDSAPTNRCYVTAKAWRCLQIFMMTGQNVNEFMSCMFVIIIFFLFFSFYYSLQGGGGNVDKNCYY